MRNTNIALFIALSALLAACSSQEPQVQMGDDAEVILGTLHRVDHARVGLAFVDPNVDFGVYDSIMLDELDLEKVEIVQPRSSVTNRRNDWQLTDDDKANLQRHFREIFTRELEETGDYKITDQAGPNVLRITAAVTGIAPNAARDDNRSRPIGRSRVYTEGAGSMSISFAFSDSKSGDIIGLVKDRRSGSPMWGANNRVTNMGDVRFMFNHWARMVRARLDIAHGY